jgi:ATP-dependent Clp protease adaptor protein ClpS
MSTHFDDLADHRAPATRAFTASTALADSPSGVFDMAGTGCPACPEGPSCPGKHAGPSEPAGPVNPSNPAGPSNPSDMPDGGRDTDILIEDEVREPRMFRVLLHNDDYTTMEFVVSILVEVFRRTPDEATRIMLAVHEKGVGECGVYTAEVAETKVALVHARARREGYPLRCTLEEV